MTVLKSGGCNGRYFEIQLEKHERGFVASAPAVLGYACIGRNETDALSELAYAMAFELSRMAPAREFTGAEIDIVAQQARLLRGEYGRRPS